MRACRCATFKMPQDMPTHARRGVMTRARHNLDRAATYAVTAFVTGDEGD
jgi:hypothetical protein